MSLYYSALSHGHPARTPHTAVHVVRPHDGVLASSFHHPLRTGHVDRHDHLLPHVSSSDSSRVSVLTIELARSGEAAGIAIFLQSRMALQGKIHGDTISFFILFFSLNLPISAALDIILAITLSSHLLRSRHSLSSSTRTISILSALSNTLLANGAVLAVFQITVAAIFLSSTQYKDVAIGLTVLGKVRDPVHFPESEPLWTGLNLLQVYTITALLGISGPLEQGRREDSSRGSGGTTAEIRHEKELRRRSVGDAEGLKRSRWCFFVRRRASTGGRGKDEDGELSFEEILQSGQSVRPPVFLHLTGHYRLTRSYSVQPRNTPTSSQPVSASPELLVTVLPRQPYSFSPAAPGTGSFSSDPEANHGIDMRYVVSDMSDADGVVAKRSDK